MAVKPKNVARGAELGVSSQFNPGDQFRQDEFLGRLRGMRGIRTFREMKDNDPIVGAVLTAMDMMIRALEWEIQPADDSPEAKRLADICRDALFIHMDSPMDELVTEILSFLPFGFAVFEHVMKRLPDGTITVKRIAPRVQWSLERFVIDTNGNYLGVRQYTPKGSVTIPINKILHFKTVSHNRDPAGRSVLRNAYLPYYYSSHIREIEAMSIERELNGLPIGRVPAEYLAAEASDDQKAFVAAFKEILSSIKNNGKSSVILPSDLQEDADGKLADKYMVDLSLVSSSGSRDVDTSKVILRNDQDIARSVMADFVMLGINDRGSFALSESKSDLFLKALEGHTGTIRSVFKSQLFTRLASFNGLDPALAPKMVHGPISPVGLEQLGNFIDRLAGAGAPLFPDDRLEDHLRKRGGLPEREIASEDMPKPTIPELPTDDIDPDIPAD